MLIRRAAFYNAFVNIG